MVECLLVVKEVFQQIIGIEEKAQKIIEDAKKQHIHIIHEAKNKAEGILASTQKEVEDGIKMMLNKAKQVSINETQNIENQAKLEIESIRKNALPKIKDAQVLCLKP